MFTLLVLFSVSLLLPTGLAHGGVSNYTVGDTWYRGYNPNNSPESQLGQPWLINRPWASIDPIFDPASLAMTCNTPGTPAVTSIPIEAGQNISAIYYYWLHNVGPMISWVAPCNGPCSSPSFNASTASWFKIGQHGLLSGTIVEGNWFQRQFQDWTGAPNVWTETIPKTLKEGEYLIRHEIVALHIENRPQWYVECAHLKVSNKAGRGKEGKLPGREFWGRLPGVWRMDDPRVNINIYSDEWYNKTTYDIPGPPVWNGE